MLTEAENMAQQERQSTEVYTAFNKIPYGLISEEIEGSSSEILTELTDICKYYDAYRKGVKFTPEGSNGDYVPATLRYKLSASLIDKEARFLFAETPDIIIESKGDVGKTTDEAKKNISNLYELIKTILDKNNFEDSLLKGAKDCFIGKRVAALVNFNEEDGVTITFLPSTQFIYETKPGSSKVLTKFVCFEILKESVTLSEKKVFKKKYELSDDGKVYLEEKLYNGAGVELEEVTAYQEIMLKKIPAVIFINDGLSEDESGESEIENILEYEKWFSKLSNSDVDAERKSMNPVRYTVDMDSNSTKKLSTSAGSFWDLMSDQNLENSSPQVGMLEPNMSFSESLKTTLERIKTTSYEQLDMPNINLETMIGSITSGKALKAVYWPLIIRCKEKMKMWGPGIREVINIIVEGSMVYPNCIKQYTDNALVPVAYEVNVVQNIPIPEDETEEKNMDLSEVDSKVMSRKTYMKKWHQLSDAEVEEELEQIALERQLLEDSFSAPIAGEDVPPYPEE